MENINIEKLRQDLVDYFGTAVFASSPVAIMNLMNVEIASDTELIKMAINNNFNLDDYVDSFGNRRK